MQIVKNYAYVVVFTGAIYQIFLELPLPGNKMDMHLPCPLEAGGGHVTHSVQCVSRGDTHHFQVETIKANAVFPQSLLIASVTVEAHEEISNLPQFLSYCNNKRAKEPH